MDAVSLVQEAMASTKHGLSVTVGLPRTPIPGSLLVAFVNLYDPIASVIAPAGWDKSCEYRATHFAHYVFRRLVGTSDTIHVSFHSTHPGLEARVQEWPSPPTKLSTCETCDKPIWTGDRFCIEHAVADFDRERAQ